MKTTTTWIIVIVLIIIAVLAYIFWDKEDAAAPIVEAPITQTFDQSISNGVVTVNYLSSDFGLATNPSQILVESSVSPCDASFSYCFYYSSTTYAGTNFDSAGITMKKRDDLATERLCTDTPPPGYSASILPDIRKPQDNFSTSVFKNIGDSGAGHIVNGSVYRLFYRANSSCYEFTTRIASTQFSNYPAGTVREFTEANAEALNNRIENIVDNILVASSSNIFP